MGDPAQNVEKKKVSSADVAVRVGRAVVAVEVEQARIRAVVPVAAHIQHKPAQSAENPYFLSFCLTWQESMIVKLLGAAAPSPPQGTKRSRAPMPLLEPDEPLPSKQNRPALEPLPQTPPTHSTSQPLEVHE